MLILSHTPPEGSLQTVMICNNLQLTLCRRAKFLPPSPIPLTLRKLMGSGLIKYWWAVCLQFQSIELCRNACTMLHYYLLYSLFRRSFSLVISIQCFSGSIFEQRRNWLTHSCTYSNNDVMFELYNFVGSIPWSGYQEIGCGKHIQASLECQSKHLIQQIMWYNVNNYLQVTVDKAFQREIEGLGVKCANHSAGCKWKGVLKEFYVSL